MKAATRCSEEAWLLWFLLMRLQDTEVLAEEPRFLVEEHEGDAHVQQNLLDTDLLVQTLQ